MHIMHTCLHRFLSTETCICCLFFFRLFFPPSSLCRRFCSPNPCLLHGHQPPLQHAPPPPGAALSCPAAGLPAWAFAGTSSPWTSQLIPKHAYPTGSIYPHWPGSDPTAHICSCPHAQILGQLTHSPFYLFFIVVCLFELYVLTLHFIYRDLKVLVYDWID